MMSHLDRRTIKDRRILTPLARGDLGRRSADSLVITILPPEEEAARVERIYEAVPFLKRNAAGLTLEHVRLVLAALR